MSKIKNKKKKSSNNRFNLTCPLSWFVLLNSLAMRSLEKHKPRQAASRRNRQFHSMLTTSSGVIL